MGDETRRQSRDAAPRARAREDPRQRGASAACAVFRSLTHIYAQLVDDDAGHARSPRHRPSRRRTRRASGSTRAKTVGTLLGERAKQKGVTEVVFDRGGYRYHGRVKALADGVREAGVELLMPRINGEHASSSPSASCRSTACPRS